MSNLTAYEQQYPLLTALPHSPLLSPKEADDLSSALKELFELPLEAGVKLRDTSILKEAFYWHETPQGYTFWAILHNKLQRSLNP